MVIAIMHNDPSNPTPNQAGVGVQARIVNIRYRSWTISCATPDHAAALVREIRQSSWGREYYLRVAVCAPTPNEVNILFDRFLTLFEQANSHSPV